MTKVKGNLNVTKDLGATGFDFDMVIIEDQKAQNTAGGTFTSGAWQTRDLNTIVYEKDTSSWFSLSANQFTLTAGKYLVVGRAPAFRVDNHQTRVWNDTDSSLVGAGSSTMSGILDFFSTDSNFKTIVDISGTKTFELQHRCLTTAATQGFGVQANFTTEVYSQVKIIRLGENS